MASLAREVKVEKESRVEDTTITTSLNLSHTSSTNLSHIGLPNLFQKQSLRNHTYTTTMVVRVVRDPKAPSRRVPSRRVPRVVVISLAKEVKDHPTA
jgi:hypothetical protein